MLSRFLPKWLVGIIAGALFLINLLLSATFVLIIAFFGFIIPSKNWRKKVKDFLHYFAPTFWTKFSRAIMYLTTKTQFDVQGSGELKSDGWYLFICNHQSWLDIIVLEECFTGKVPMIKFFMKRELLWTLPLAGLACYALDFPFMQRYSKEYLRKHPEKAGKDLETTQRACEKFKGQPISIMNFIEGTRFTQKKHDKQASPYQHLLKPKAGGLAFALQAMQAHLNYIVNVTIIYPDQKTNLWKFLCGGVKKIIIHYEVLPISNEMSGDYQNNAEFRAKFHQWLNQLWQDKDRLIENTLQQEQP